MVICNAEKEARFRARRREEGRNEVRGIYATTEQAKKIKDYAENLRKTNKL